MYDYVIVGAGSAGCVVARRLGEDPDVKVAVIEAGPPDDAPEIHMPLAVRAEPDQPVGLDAALSEPEPGLDHRRNYLPRGRVLGGSSSLNAMIYIRGNRADYDEWAAMGLDGLGLRRRAAVLQARRGQRARGEPLSRRRRPAERQRQPLDAPVVEAWIEAAGRGRDRRTTRTSTARRRTAPGRFQVTQRDGRRCSTAVAYLHPAAARGNVDVLTDARVYPDPLRGRPRRRRGVHAPRPARGAPRRARGHRLARAPTTRRSC